MKTVFKRIIHCFDQSFRFLRWLFLFLTYGTKPVSYKNHNSKTRVFIMGNGPSLEKDVSSFVKHLHSEDIIMMNFALLTQIAFNLKPNFYVLADPVFFVSNTTDINRSDQLHELSTKFEEVDWKMILFVPNHLYQNRDHQRLVIKNPLITIQTINGIELQSFSWIDRLSYTSGLAIPSSINVLIVALCCAIHMKYKKIYILGADSDWHRQIVVDNKTNEIFTQDTHFYTKQINKKKITGFDLASIMDCIAQAFKAYKRLNDLNFPIINLSSNSMIDAFPRSTLEEVFEEVK